MRQFQILLILVTLVAILPACEDPGNENELYGYVEAKRIYLAADISGKITQIDFAEGDVIAAGQQIFQLDSLRQQANLNALLARKSVVLAQLADSKIGLQRPEDIQVLEASLEKAEIQSQYASTELSRAKDLVAKKVWPPNKLDSAQTAYDQSQTTIEEIKRSIAAARVPARAGQTNVLVASVKEVDALIEQAQVELDKCAIYSSHSGIIDEIFYRQDEVIAAGQPVLSIIPNDKLIVRFFVPQVMRSKIAINQQIALRADGLDKELSARISFIASQPEYTPPIMLNEKSRKELVYMMEAHLAFDSGLSPGQPLTIVLPFGKDDE